MADQLLLCRHTSRFLLWWLTGFPFAAWSSYGWVTPFVTAVVTFLLLGTENIGIQIEEPFEVLPIEAITAACIASVHEILERHHGEMPACTVLVLMLRRLLSALIWNLRWDAYLLREFGSHGILPVCCCDCQPSCTVSHCLLYKAGILQRCLLLSVSLRGKVVTM